MASCECCIGIWKNGSCWVFWDSDQGWAKMKIHFRENKNFLPHETKTKVQKITKITKDENEIFAHPWFWPPPMMPWISIPCVFGRNFRFIVVDPIGLIYTAIKSQSHHETIGFWKSGSCWAFWDSDLYQTCLKFTAGNFFSKKARKWQWEKDWMKRSF